MLTTPYAEVPPRGYGGTELFVANLIDGLVDLGHDVTVFGVGESRTRGTFVRVRDEAQFERMGQLMPEMVHIATVEPMLAEGDFDLVHDNTVAGLLMAPFRKVPTVATMHGPMDDEMGTIAEAVCDSVDLVAISDNQRDSGRRIRWAATIHHAIKVSEFPYREDKEHWALFLGRVTPEKGIVEAIKGAREAGIPLRIAAKCAEPQELAYWDEEVEPLLGPGVAWLGEVGGAQKLDLLSRAKCLLFPIQWDEPFGLVMIEALACGTPVVAMERGSVGEVLEDGVTGLLADSDDDVPRLLREVGSLRPEDCRHAAATRFDIPRMAADYERVYREAIERRSRPTPRAVS